MVTEVNRKETVEDIETQLSGVKAELPPMDAWKIVGSPARRASINPENMDGLNGVGTRNRAASISGFSFQLEPSAPPPGLVGENGALDSTSWSEHIADYDTADDFKDMSERISKESPETAGDDLTEEEYLAIPKGRSRSKSSSAIFGSSEDPFDPKLIPNVSSIWSNSDNQRNSLHRRASTQPSQQTLMWEALRAAQLATPNDPNGLNTDELMERFKKENFVQSRRLSVAPSMIDRFMARNISDEVGINSSYAEQGRRHSLAGTLFERGLNEQLTEGLKDLGLSEQLGRIDDYFENTESRTMAFKEAGKNLLASQEDDESAAESPEINPGYQWPLYVIEFKAGRTDYFYVPETSKGSLKIKVGDLAIVEADRGKDLGKVIETNISSLKDLQLYQATHVDPLVDSHNGVGGEIQPKKIYRLAAPNEVGMLISKSEDESKANALCQSKVRQKKLPMEIVDAEYQWDRRKLTFYFVADRRIDFRELVRELFKLYKTRIWMCAVNPSS